MFMQFDPFDKIELFEQFIIKSKFISTRLRVIPTVALLLSVISSMCLIIFNCSAIERHKNPFEQFSLFQFFILFSHLFLPSIHTNHINNEQQQQKYFQQIYEIMLKHPTDKTSPR